MERGGPPRAHPTFSLSFVRATSASRHFSSLVREFLVPVNLAPRKLKRVRNRGRAFYHARDHIRTSKPVRLRKIRYRPLRGMIGMGVIEANDVFAALASFALNADQF